jgi:hypothetical protein
VKVVFHTNQLNVLGTSVAVFDYAHFNEKLLGNESLVMYEKNHLWNEQPAVDHFKKRFPLLAYEDFAHVDRMLMDAGADVCYYMKSGERDGKINKYGRCAVHVVFQAYEPHGDVYAYLSQWLSDKVTGGVSPVVPPIVQLPAPTSSLRATLGIPERAVVFGRHGGWHDLDLDFAQRAIERVAKEKSDIFFVLVNTRPFCTPLPNIIHLPATSDLQFKANFIASCDAMVHGRSRGETFGLAIAEFLYSGKPVFAWTGGTMGQNHHALLKDKKLFYDSEDELYRALIGFESWRWRASEIKAWVAPFAPEPVMRKFSEVFLSGT